MVVDRFKAYRIEHSATFPDSLPNRQHSDPLLPDVVDTTSRGSLRSRNFVELVSRVVRFLWMIV